MMRPILSLPILLLLALPPVETAASGRARPVRTAPGAMVTTPRNRSAGSLPVVFEENRGQVDTSFAYVARAGRCTAGLRSSGAIVLGASPAGRDVFGLSIPGARPDAQCRALGRTPGRSNYLRGQDPAAWVRDVPHASGVAVTGVLPGVEIVWRDDGGRLCFDLRLDAGILATDVVFEVTGGGSVRTGRAGELIVPGEHGDLRLSPPRAFQTRRGETTALPVRFLLHDDGRFGFRVDGRDPLRSLVIDPTLTYATYLGGSSDEDYVSGVAVDSYGCAHVASSSSSTDLPVSASAYDRSWSAQTDAFAAKIAADGKTILWLTYLGGDQGEHLSDLALDGSGNVYLVGYTWSKDFPTTTGAYRASKTTGGIASFLTKLSASGSSLLCSTYSDDTRRYHAVVVDSEGYAIVGSRIGDPYLDKMKKDFSGPVWTATIDRHSSGTIQVHDVAVDSEDGVVMVGSSDSAWFPATTGAYQTSVKGVDAYAIKYDADGKLVWATLLGGAATDSAFGVGLDLGDRVYLVGLTASTDFPTKSAHQSSNAGKADAFAARLSADGSALEYSTYLGGKEDECASGVGVHFSGVAYVAGSTNSSDFPVKNADQGTLAGSHDMFLTRLHHDGTVTHSTYYGGQGTDVALAIALKDDGSATMIGPTKSTDFPTTTGVIQATMSAPRDMAIVTWSDNLPTSVTPLAIATTGLADRTVGAEVSDSLVGAGGLTPYAWSVTAGSLPDGLILSEAGTISGTPTTSTTAVFTVQLHDRTGVRVEKELALTINEVPEIVSTSLPDWTIDRPFDNAINVSGGSGALAWEITAGTLPDGIALGSTGVLTGTPTKAGSWSFSVRVTDAAEATASRSLAIVVHPWPLITTTTLPAWTASVAFPEPIQASDGTLPYAWSIVSGTPPFPSGIEADTGRMKGMPGSAAVYEFEVRLTDAAGATDTRSFSMTIHAFPRILTRTLPFAAAGRPFDLKLAVTGGTPPVGFLVGSGSLPSGLTLDETSGALEGKPATAGSYAFEGVLRDAVGAEAVRPLQLTVAPRATLSASKNRETLILATTGAHRLVRYLELIEGSELSFKVKRKGGALAVTSVYMLDAEGETIALAPHLKLKEKSATAQDVPIPKTGRYFVVVDVKVTEAEALLRIDVEATAPKKLLGGATLSAAGEFAIPIAVLPGSTVKLTVKGDKASGVRPRFVQLRNEAGEPWAAETKVSEKGSKSSVKVLTPCPGKAMSIVIGTHDGTAGPVTWKIKVKRPSGYVLDLPDHVAGR
jgi:Putative Ig domain/Beta-propeller repeat